MIGDCVEVNAVYLIIDNSVDSVIEVYYWLNNKWQKEDFSADIAGKLVGCIQSVLDKLELDKKAVQGIGMVIGKGRFTSTRIVVTMANIFAYAWGIPVHAFLALTLTDDTVEQFRTKKRGEYVTPIYSSEPRIGV